jgi:hypothetical protein
MDADMPMMRLVFLICGLMLMLINTSSKWEWWVGLLYFAIGFPWPRTKPKNEPAKIPH